jgi:hypothetical protein
VPHSGRNGQRFNYELAFDGDTASDAPQAVGLIDPLRLQTSSTTMNLAGANGDLAGSLRPASGHLAGTLRGDKEARIASAGADIPSLVAAVDQTALLEEPREPRRSNGASYTANLAGAP